MDRATRLLLLFAALLLLPDCVGRSAGQATSSALDEVSETLKEIPEDEQGVIAERAAKGMVRGALDELETPERQAQLSGVIDRAVSDSLRSMVDPSWSASSHGGAGTGGGGASEGTGSMGSASGPRASSSGPPMQRMGAQLGRGMTTSISAELQRELGEDATGPLAQALASSTERMSASAVAGVRQELRAILGTCTEADPRECLDRRVYELGQAASAGALSALRIPLLLLTFAIGFGAALLLVRVMQHSGRRRAVA